MRRSTIALLAAVAFGAALSAVACGDSPPSDTATSSGTTGDTSATTGSGATTSATTGPSSSSSGNGGAGGQGSSTGQGGMGGAPDCYMNPMTHVEIINACTDADKVDKTPVLPLLLPGGGLPPLP